MLTDTQDVKAPDSFACYEEQIRLLQNELADLRSLREFRREGLRQTDVQIAGTQMHISKLQKKLRRVQA